MNINTGVISVNANNMLVKKQLNREVENKVTESGLKINEKINQEFSEEEERISDISVVNENLTASETTIKNVDMAEELLINTKNNILQHSVMSMLAQANKKSSDVITLLQ